MNYKIINTAILTARDISSKSFPRDNKFYNYLLDNNVAYYYSTQLSQEKTVMDERIIAAADILNNRFIKTLKLINKVSKENNIKFLLFKTYKYIPEIVDGDIDLFIQEKDFHNLLKALEKEGFNCFEHEHLKAFCSKEGYCAIEPRVNASFNELVILNEKKVWQKVEYVKVCGEKVLTVTKEIDVFYLLLNVLYGPKYLKLYLFLLFKNIDVKKLYIISSEKQVNQDLKFLLRNLITENVENKRFPLFMGDIDFTVWWYKRILSNSSLTLFMRLKHIIFFFYSKYSYRFFNNLVYRHKWPLS